MTLVSNTFSGYTVDAEVFIAGSVMGRQEGETLNQKLSFVYFWPYTIINSNTTFTHTGCLMSREVQLLTIFVSTR